MDEVIIVLGSRLSSQEIHPQLKGRLDVALGFGSTLKNPHYIVSGGKTNQNVPKTEAKAMSEYLISNGVNRKQIFLEERSMDTIGNAYFSRLLLKKLGDPSNIFVITSCYHMNRSKFIFDYCFGNGFRLNYEHCFKYQVEDDDEEESLKKAYDFFKGIVPGDYVEIGFRLISTHPLYRNLKLYPGANS